jgi:D-lactate dehydrogenase
MPGVPERWKELAPESAAILVEFRTDDEQALDESEAKALELLEGRTLIEAARFTREPDETRMFWHVREGLHGLMAAMRPAGAMLMMEDVCVPPARVAEAAKDIPELLRKHGFLWGVAGHASAGNLHFTLTPNFDKPEDLERYEAFMHDLVELIVDKYDGSLKAEHGTGMNMAPFVEREWGPKATEMMWRVKRLADPAGILAPGIVLNRDPNVHLRNLKSSPEIEPVATKCIECGACEPVCPSRNVTTTPRQRIVLRREMARQPQGSPVLKALLEQYEYDALQTCAADGTCGPACPVGIDTGKLVKELRAREHSGRAQRAGRELARHYATAERAARAALRLPAGAWRSSLPAAAPARLPFTIREGAAAVYLPACVNRIFGNPRGEPAHPTVPEALVAISQRAGLPVWIPEGAPGHCCGMPWSSKGFTEGNELISRRTADAIAGWTNHGELPVVIDASSCTHALREADVEVLDSIEWVHDHLLERLELKRRLATITVHPNCSAGHLGLAPKLTAIAQRMADELVMPAFTSCCGMAGDRGWLHPELPASALRDSARELAGREIDAAVSSNRTCEAALQEVTGRDYRSFVLVLEELTRQ